MCYLPPDGTWRREVRFPNPIWSPALFHMYGIGRCDRAGHTHVSRSTSNIISPLLSEMSFVHWVVLSNENTITIIHPSFELGMAVSIGSGKSQRIPRSSCPGTFCSQGISDRVDTVLASTCVFWRGPPELRGVPFSVRCEVLRSLCRLTHHPGEGTEFTELFVYRTPVLGHRSTRFLRATGNLFKFSFAAPTVFPAPPLKPRRMCSDATRSGVDFLFEGENEVPTFDYACLPLMPKPPSDQSGCEPPCCSWCISIANPGLWRRRSSLRLAVPILR